LGTGKRITFEISIDPSSIERDRANNDIRRLEAHRLWKICRGKLSISFEPQNQRISIETELIDYLLQVKEVIKEIENGVSEIVAVSRGDHFSNNINFRYELKSDTLEIYEVNAGEFDIKCSFAGFQREFTEFFGRAMIQILVYYPELQENRDFRAICV